MDDELEITCLQPLRLIEIDIWFPPFSDIFSKAPDYIASSWEHAEWSIRAFTDAHLPSEMIVAIFFDHLPDSPPDRRVFHYFTLFLENGESYLVNQQKVLGIADAFNRSLQRVLTTPRLTPLARRLAAIMAEFAEIPHHAF